MITAEAIQEIAKLARKSQALRVVELDGVSDNVLIDQGGAFVEMRVPPSPRSHEVFTISDLAAAVKRWSRSDAETVIYHNYEHIQAVVDDLQDRFDTITMRLTLSSEIDLLERIHSKVR